MFMRAAVKAEDGLQGNGTLLLQEPEISAAVDGVDAGTTLL